MLYSNDVFVVQTKVVHGFGGEGHKIGSTFRRIFGQHFGTIIEHLPLLCHYCVDDEELTVDQSKNAEPTHLLWCLYHLKVYSTEVVSAKKVGVDEKTFEEWTRIFRVLLSEASWR